MTGDRLKLYLNSFAAPLCVEMTTWGQQLLRVCSYLDPDDPPAEYVTSVRCVVLRDNSVLVVHDPHELHITPGGRRAPGETFQQTAVREVGEETGWTIGNLRPLGVKHFHHLSPKSPNYPYPYPDFLQLIYLGDSLAHEPGVRKGAGWEIASAFQPITGSLLSILRLSDRHFLNAARRLNQAPAARL